MLTCDCAEGVKRVKTAIQSWKVQNHWVKVVTVLTHLQQATQTSQIPSATGQSMWRQVRQNVPEAKFHLVCVHVQDSRQDVSNPVKYKHFLSDLVPTF